MKKREQARREVQSEGGWLGVEGVSQVTLVQLLGATVRSVPPRNPEESDWLYQHGVRGLSHFTL